MQAHLSFPDETPVAGKLPELQGFQKSTYFPEILYREGGDLGSKSLPAVGRKSVYSANKDRTGRDFVKLVTTLSFSLGVKSLYSHFP